MNTRVAIARRDAAAAGVIALAAAALLFAWSPALRPGSPPLRLTPPAIVYSPALLTDGDHQEQYDEWDAAHSPALIALSAAMMLPPAKRGQADAVIPPLDAPAPRLPFPDMPATERNDRIPLLTPPRPMTPLAPQRLAHPGPRPPAPSTLRMGLAGDLQGHAVDLAPMLELREPAAPWSFSAVLRYDEKGRVQSVLLETAEFAPSLRDEVVRRLYRCRVTPSGAPGEGRLTVSGPGRP
ncbi:MAG: hypothetical protein WC381_09865 [Kiritimatiellia bacterium]|jgi:hypothetical protein